MIHDAIADRVLTLDRLVGFNRAELDELYGAVQAGPIPRGRSRGRAIFFPGTDATHLMAVMAQPIWQGKVFDPAGGTLKNQVLGGFQLFKAKVYKAESWHDGKESIIIDYSETSRLVGSIRDEIRRVAPGLYLGIAFLRSAARPRVVYFALDFNG